MRITRILVGRRNAGTNTTGGCPWTEAHVFFYILKLLVREVAQYAVNPIPDIPQKRGPFGLTTNYRSDAFVSFMTLLLGLIELLQSHALLIDANVDIPILGEHLSYEIVLLELVDTFAPKGRREVKVLLPLLVFDQEVTSERTGGVNTFADLQKGRHF
jgi:hypothetical protein